MPQSLLNIPLHVVFSTKNREPFIDRFLEGQLYAFLIANASKQGNYVYKIGGIEDHIHMLIALHKTQAPCELIENLKKNSSRWAKTKGDKYRSFSWQRGYGMFAVSPIHAEAVIQYISTQKEHHKDKTFKDEFRILLKKNFIEYDERYVWD